MQKTNSCDLKFFRIDKVKINLKFRNTKIKKIYVREKKLTLKNLKSIWNLILIRKKASLRNVSKRNCQSCMAPQITISVATMSKKSLSLLKIYMKTINLSHFYPVILIFLLLLFSLSRVFSAIFETMFIKSMCSCAIRKHYEMKNRNSRFYDFLNELSAIFNFKNCFIFNWFWNFFEFHFQGVPKNHD